MSIPLREVLHLYRRSPILIYDNLVDPDAYVSAYLEGVDWELENIVIAERTSYNIKQVKPVLKRWENLTEDAIRYIYDLPNDAPVSVPHYRGMFPDQFLRALEEGIDLFDLIDRGLAVDAETLKNTNLKTL